jgi:NAD(P)-dependent dehydrogenase (short-subunit alcohol dehydrogenase family)
MSREGRETPVAIVTGGAQGIGAACCVALAREGCRVGMHFRSDRTEELPDAVRQGVLERVPPRRMGRPEEIAEVVAFLA